MDDCVGAQLHVAYSEGYQTGFEDGEKSGTQRVIDTQVVILKDRLVKLIAAAEDFVEIADLQESTDIWSKSFLRALMEAKKL